MNELVAPAGNGVDLASAFDVLAAVPAESLWLPSSTVARGVFEFCSVRFQWKQWVACAEVAISAESCCGTS